MSGHSKWATIKRKKAVTDGRRSSLFTKLIRELTVATKEGGANPDGNPRLRLAITTAKKNSLPKDAMERAINKGAGNDGAAFQEIVYEGIGAGGIAFMVETQTDNPNRTVANLRAAFTRGGGALGTSGSVAYLFERKGQFQVPAALITDEEALTLELIDAGAEDVENDGDLFHVTCPFEQFGSVHAALDRLKLESENSELVRLPMNTVAVDSETAEKVLKLIDKLEDDEDVAKVFHNLELSEAVMAHLA
jgi:YebC/PmpR family DNA-binding regulatory protein